MQFIKRALDIAKKGQWKVSPNPMVGAVFVRDGKILAEGWHRFFGGPHAEIEALRSAERKKISLRNSTLYVTLEPCSHKNIESPRLGSRGFPSLGDQREGGRVRAQRGELLGETVGFPQKKTPPCIPEIISAKPRRVVIAMQDPNPEVNGKGIAALRRAGIKVEVGCMEIEASRLNEKFIKWITTGMPFVAMKVAMSLDGKIATKTGNSKWITGEASRREIKYMRNNYDAIIVGVNTVEADNPKLAGTEREPLRVILDSNLRTPHTAKVLRDRNVLIVTTNRAQASRRRYFEKRGIELKIFSATIRLTPLLRFLAGRGISSVLVEGGAEIFGSCIDEKIADRFHFYIAPKIIGGRNAKTAIAGEGAALLKKCLTLKNIKMRFCGPDAVIDGYA